MPAPPRDVNRVLSFVTTRRAKPPQARDPFPPDTRRPLALYGEMVLLFPRLSVEAQQALVDLSRAALSADLHAALMMPDVRSSDGPRPRSRHGKRPD